MKTEGREKKQSPKLMNQMSYPFHPLLERDRGKPVTTRALTQRINRALAKQGEQLRKTRAGSPGWIDTGDYYTITIGGNWLVEGHIDLEEKGRELGVLKGYECLAE